MLRLKCRECLKQKILSMSFIRKSEMVRKEVVNGVQYDVFLEMYFCNRGHVYTEFKKIKGGK